MTYSLLLLKRFVENLFIYPFILIGRFIAYIKPLKNEYRVFFFFPFYHTGGAEKVHAQVANATGGNDSIIFFTKKPADDRFLNDFIKSGCTIKDISRFTDNKWLYFLNLFYRGIVTGYINKQQHKPIIFNGQCNFAYKISPWIKKGISQIELIHSLNSFSYIRIPFLPFIDKTVMISQKRIEDHKRLYKQYKIPISFTDRIIYIPNAIKLPDGIFRKNDDTFTVLYVGRATEEKRVELVAAIAKKLNEKAEDVKFEMLGDILGVIEQANYPYIKFYGNTSDEKKISNIYANAHALIIVSTTEGFPMVIMEAMAHGCAVLSTGVGDIPYHVKNNVNGFLFSKTEDEPAIINEAIENILWLMNNRQELQKIAAGNIAYAKHNFGIERFNKDYQKLFSSINQRIEAT